MSEAIPRYSNRWGERVWSVATLSTAVVFQVVLGALVLAWALPDAGAFVTDDVVENSRMALLTASGIVLVIALLIGGVLACRPSPMLRGVGLSVAASGVVASIMGVAYVLWIH